MDSYISKPVDPSLLFAAVEQVQPPAPHPVTEFAVEERSRG
jgi:hypothetical protein